MDKKKRILIVSPFFASENSIASIRFTKIGKYLAKDGNTVDVLCGKMHAEMIEDNTLKCDIKWFEKVIRVKFPGLYYLPLKVPSGNAENSGEKKKFRIIEEILAKFYKIIRNDFSSSIWLFVWDRILAALCINAIKREKWQYFDVVITTYSPMLSHYVGRYLKKKRMCGIWIADYRDPFLGQREKKMIPGFVFQDNLKVEKMADFVTTVSKGTKEQIAEEAGKDKDEIRKKIHVVYNGYDIDDRQNIKTTKRKNEKLQIAYCGMLGIVKNRFVRSPEMLFKALWELKEEGKVQFNELEFIYAGPSSDYLKQCAKKYNVLDIVKDCGYVTREKSLEIQSQADIILLCSWNTNKEQGILTGKFYEAMLLEKKVLALISGEKGNSELKEIIQDCNIGFCCEESMESDYENLKKWLAIRFQEKRKNGKIKYDCSEKRFRFRHDVIAMEMEKIWTE